MINDSDIKHLEYELDELESKLRRAKDDQLKYESEIRTMKQNIDETKRQQKREQDRAVEEKRRKDAQDKVDKERGIRRAA